VRSLTLSTILLIIGGAFAENLHSAFVLAFPEIRYTSAVTVGVNLNRITESADSESLVIEEVSAALDYYKDPPAAAVMFNPNYTAELRADAFTADYREYVSGENTVKTNIISFDDGMYRKILDLAGAKYGEAVLFNRWNYKSGIKVTLFAPFNFAEGILTVSSSDGVREQFEIGGELTEFPIELTTILNVDVPLNIIVPKGSNPTRAVWFYETADAESLSEFFSAELQGKGASYFFYLEADKNASKSMQMVFNSVLFIFVGAVVFIGLSGVISTIATQTGIRRKEIAILRSVGETESGIRKMFAAESLLYGIKSLVYGGAVGIPLAYFAISSSVGSIVVVKTERLMPIGSIAAAVGIIAAVVACTTLYSVRLSRSVNLIDAIRGE
jgi:putative ABC transport system permease protein